MKKTLYFVMAACIVLLAACAGSPKDNMVGTWKIADITVDGELSEEETKMMDAMKEMMVGKMEMTFDAEGNFTSKQPNPFKEGEVKETKGTWTISEDGKTLKTKEEGSDKEEEIKLSELTGSKMVMVNEEGEKTMSMVFEK